MEQGQPKFDRQTAVYLENMISELRQMSSGSGFDVLTYLLEMALIEATDLAHGIHLKEQSHDAESENTAEKWYSA